MKEVVIIDYSMGNLRSVQKALEHIGVDAVISNELETISKAKKLILPGVGHFAQGVKNLKKLNLWELLNKRVNVDKTPILGICLGMQLMASSSEEGNVEGLGWFEAKVVRFKVLDTLRYKVPHIGWNTISIRNNSLMLNNLDPDSKFYFVHSYHFQNSNERFIIATTNYEYEFVSVVVKDNIFGVQFHPEKSQENGSILLSNFIKI